MSPTSEPPSTRLPQTSVDDDADIPPDWFEREFMQYVFQEFDLHVLGAQKAKLVLVNGKETDPEACQYLCNVALGKKLGLEVNIFSGWHVAFVVGPQVFAEELRGLLKGRDPVYAHL